MLALRVLHRSLGLVSTLLLARLLVPADFAIIAIGTLVVQLLDIICNTGARQYLVQVERIEPDAVNTAWTLDILFRVAAVLLLFLSLPLVDLFWRNDSATAAIAWMAPTMLLRALQSPELHIDVRELRFGRLFRLELTKKFVATLVLLLAAWWLRSFWAIVISMWVSAVVGVAMSHWMCAHRPALCTRGIREQWRFSRWIVSRGFIGYLRAQVDTLLASKAFGASLFGQYTLARELTVLPSTDIVVPLVQPLLSTFSRVRNEPAELARQLRGSLLVVATLVAPICALLYTRGDVALGIALGPGWEAAEAMVAPMIPMLYAFSFGGISHSLLIAQGQVRLLFLYDVVSLAATVLILVQVVDASVTTFILTRGLTETAMIFGMLSWRADKLSVSPIETLGLLAIPPVVAAMVVFAASALLDASGLATATHEIVELIVFSNLVLIGYAMLMLALAAKLRTRHDSWAMLWRISGTATRTAIEHLPRAKAT